MKRKCFCCFLSLCLIFSLCSCKKENLSEKSDGLFGQEQQVINPFTGEIMANQKAQLRPVGVVINNLNSAQKVQTGVAAADIVYETEVEGGITRLLAIYKDIEEASEFGSIRSARVVFASLAQSHGAIFVHHGIDPNYAAPYILKNKITDFDTNKKPASAYAYRKNNSMSSEHTVYSSYELLNEGFKKNSIATTALDNKPWCLFTQSQRIPSEGVAANISVRFSGSYISLFTFDAASGFYIKTSKKFKNSDYVTKQAYYFKNVFVLKTDISLYPDGVHREVSLSGGEGYYFSLGGYEKIFWEKREDAPITFFSLDGQQLQVNKGNSWVCIAKAFKPEPA